MDSPFSNLLNTNYIPSDNEVKDIKRIVASRGTLLKCLNEQIQALTEERERHARFIEDHNALASPFRRLPTDILSSVFLSYLDQCRWRSWYRGRQHPSDLLTHICRRWRDVALETSLLWSLVRIQIPRCPYVMPLRTSNSALWDQLIETWIAKMRTVEETLAMCLERSASCPLQLAVETSEVRAFGAPEQLGSMQEDATNRVVSAICRESHRWERIDINVTIISPTSPLYRFLSLPSEAVPQLRSIQICCGLPWGGPFPEALVEHTFRGLNMLGSASLRTMKWGTALNSLTVSVIPVSWNSLTGLYLGAESGTYGAQLSFTDSLTLLSKCPRLVHCTLALWSGRHRQPDTPEGYPTWEEVSLHCLRTLGIRALEIPPGFARALSVPSLRTFAAYENQWSLQSSGETNGLVECIQTFGSQLKDVSFSYAILSQRGLLACLESLPVVTRLRVTADCQMGASLIITDNITDITPASFDDATLAELTPTYDAQGALTKPCYCPALEELCCNVEGKALTEQGLIKFVTSRRSIPGNARRDIASLREVSVKYDFKETLDVRGALQEKGVDLEGCGIKVFSRSTDLEAARGMDWGESLMDRYGDGWRDYREEAELNLPFYPVLR